MIVRLPVIRVLGQDYTVDVQDGIVTNTLFPDEVLSLAGFHEIVLRALREAEERGDAGRGADARRVLRSFTSIVPVVPPGLRSNAEPEREIERGAPPAPARRRARRSGRDR